MLRIKSKIQKSKICGLGLFADQFVPKGFVTWEYDKNFDPVFTERQLNLLPEIGREYILKYAYFDKNLNKFVLCLDNQKYINHSENKQKRNINSTPTRDIAIKDINPGEELLCDYSKFDSEYFKRIGIKKKDLK